MRECLFITSSQTGRKRNAPDGFELPTTSAMLLINSSQKD
jgi:hypothetical protein